MARWSPLPWLCAGHILGSGPSPEARPHSPVTLSEWNPDRDFGQQLLGLRKSGLAESGQAAWKLWAPQGFWLGTGQHLLRPLPFCLVFLGKFLGERGCPAGKAVPAWGSGREEHPLPRALLSPLLADFEQESGLETAMRFIPDMALAAPTAPAMLPTTVIQPVDTPFEELLSEHPSPEPVTSPPLVTEVTEVVEEPSQRATTISATTSTTEATTTGAPTMATAPAMAATTAPSTPAAPPATATTTDVRTTGIQGLLPLPLTTAATAKATTPAAPLLPTTVATLDTETPTPRLVSTATSRPRALPQPVTTQEPDAAERTTLPLGTTASGPTEVAQVRTVGERLGWAEVG